MNENERNEQWRERIRAYWESGQTMRAWFAAQEIPFNQLKYYRLRKLSPGKRKSQTTTWEPPLSPFGYHLREQERIETGADVDGCASIFSRTANSISVDRKTNSFENCCPN